MVTPLQEVYSSVQVSVTILFVIFGLIIGSGVVLVIIGSTKSSSCALTIALFLSVLGLNVLAGSSIAKSKAEESVTSSWEAAKLQQATYEEVLHAPFVQVGEDHIQCENGQTYESCKYYNTEHRKVGEDCTTDKKGRKSCTARYQDYYWPWFYFERNIWAAIAVEPRLAESPLVVKSEWKWPRMYFALNHGPENCAQNIRNQPDRFFNADCSTPREWSRIQNGIAEIRPVVGSVGHHYLNYFHVNDDTVFKVYGGNVQAYEKAGLLPVMNNIYSKLGEQVGYDYNFAQFLSGVKPVESEQVWQDTAALWAAEAGTKLQASLILFFAPESKIPNRTEWMNTTKARLMSKAEFDRRILPKNLIFIGCAVNAENTLATWCSMDTGMFMGNNQVKDIFQQQANVPLTTNGFFGFQSATYQKAEDGSYKFNFQRGQGLLDLLYAPQPNGFKRVSMGPNDYMMTNVEPTPQQRFDIVNSARWSTGLYFLLEGAVLIFIGVFFFYSSK